MADDIGMRPAPAGATMNRLAEAGTTMTDGWRSANAELSSLAGQLGKGELGAAFLAGYQQPAADTAKVVAQCCAAPGKFAESGNQIVAQYVAADQHGQQAINSAG